jgi:hypothetical protein
VFVAEVSQNSTPNSPVTRSRRNQCCALAWGSYTGFHCSEVLGLRPTLNFSSGARACESVGYWLC